MFYQTYKKSGGGVGEHTDSAAVFGSVVFLLQDTDQGLQTEQYPSMNASKVDLMCIDRNCKHEVASGRRSQVGKSIVVNI